jgi:hypothetical protein
MVLASILSPMPLDMHMVPDDSVDCEKFERLDLIVVPPQQCTSYSLKYVDIILKHYSMADVIHQARILLAASQPHHRDAAVCKTTIAAGNFRE